jgi:hypothetical protein
MSAVPKPLTAASPPTGTVLGLPKLLPGTISWLARVWAAAFQW